MSGELRFSSPVTGNGGSASPGVATWGTGRLRRSDRREIILATALEMIRKRGFHATTIDQIGVAAGVTGPAVYRHFGSKMDLLIALLDQTTERLLDGARRIRAKVLSPREAIEALVAFHVRFALDDRPLIAVYVHEVRSLPDVDRRRLRRRQRLYVEDWSETLRQLRPGLSAVEARVVVQATFGLLNSVAFYDVGLERACCERLLAQMAMAALEA